MVRCPTDGMTIKSKDSNNQRIAQLEEKVAEQAKTIAQLQHQLQALSAIFSNAAQCLSEKVSYPDEPAEEPVTELANGSSSEKTEEDGSEESGAASSKKEAGSPVVPYNYKNLLQEHCVRQGWERPIYETSKCPGGYSSVVTLNEQDCTSKTMKSKVIAEKSAACLMLQSLNVIDEHGIPVADGEPRKHSGVSKYSWCKNQLQEYFAKCGHLPPTYTNIADGGKGFKAEVSHDKFPDKVLGPTGSSKRIAEQMAAHKAITVWNILQTVSDS